MKTYRIEGGAAYSYPIYKINITKQVKLMTREVLKLVPYNKIILVCRGSSGLYIATMMQFCEPDRFDLLYVRKEGEKQHSETVYNHCDTSGSELLFVDDFVCKGSTLRRCNSWCVRVLGRGLDHVMLMSALGEDRMRRVIEAIDNVSIKTLILGV